MSNTNIRAVLADFWQPEIPYGKLVQNFEALLAAYEKDLEPLERSLAGRHGDLYDMTDLEARAHVRKQLVISYENLFMDTLEARRRQYTGNDAIAFDKANLCEAIRRSIAHLRAHDRNRSEWWATTIDEMLGLLKTF